MDEKKRDETTEGMLGPGDVEYDEEGFVVEGGELDNLKGLLDRWHSRVFPRTKEETGTVCEQEIALGKIEVIEVVLMWIDHAKRVKEQKRKMGKSVEEWEMYFAQLSPEFLEEVIAAIETLQKAEMFFEEYEWTHLFTLVKIAKRVAEDRAEWGISEMELPIL